LAVAQVVATLAAGLFAGAAIYVNVAEHPARMECGTPLAVAEFGPSYRRAAVMQAALAVIGSVAGASAWWLGAGRPWLIGAVVLSFAVPFTVLVILPTNQRLLDPGLDKTSAEAHALLVRWGRLHGVRSVAGAISFLLFVWLR
jgi:hypothetical protein